MIPEKRIVHLSRRNLVALFERYQDAGEHELAEMWADALRLFDQVDEYSRLGDQPFNKDS